MAMVTGIMTIGRVVAAAVAETEAAVVAAAATVEATAGADNMSKK